MAQGLRALDVLAKYGTVRDEVKYGLLQQVSHWTERDVRCESETYARSHVAASYVLHERFDEDLLMLFYVWRPEVTEKTSE